jgi:hypothetical protein
MQHVKCIPCHHGVARPRVAYGEDGLQICRVALNILNNQSLTSEMGRSSSYGVGSRHNFSAKKKVMKCTMGSQFLMSEMFSF